jgi:hypothetical protein
MADDGNFIGASGFGDERRGATAVGTLKIFEYYDGNLSAFGRLQGGCVFLGKRESAQEQEREGSEKRLHILFDAGEGVSLW